MAPLFATIKTALAVALLAVLVSMPAAAASFSVKRGINLDLWSSWPSEDKWGDASVLLPFPEWRRSVGKQQLSALKEAGFDFVRMPIDPAPLMSETSAALHGQLYADVLASVRLANSAGLKVLVDLHTIPWGDDRSVGTGALMDDEALFERYVEMLRKVAATLSAEDPTQVALELMNEPIMTCEADDPAWSGKLKRLFAAARASATRTTLVLTGACWSSAEGLSRLDPSAFPDDNLIWTFHSYEPFLLTHQGATWAGDFIPYVTGIPYPPDSVPREERDAILESVRETMRAKAPMLRRDGLLAYLDEQFGEIDTREKLRTVMAKPFETVDAWREQHNIAPESILLGEFGMIRQEYGNPFVMRPEWRAAYVKDTVALAEKHGFAWSVWSFSGAFGIVDEFENKPAEPDVTNMIRDLPAR